MATPLTDAINALTAYANEVTGASDTTLSDAVETLVAGYGQSGGYTLDDIAGGALQRIDDATITLSEISTPYAFCQSRFNTVRFPNATEISGNLAFQSGSMKYIDLPKCEYINNAFYGCSSIIASVGETNILKLPKIKRLGEYAFYGCRATNVYFYQTDITSISYRAFYNDTYIQHIYVPWSEGAVANAPWGASNATIHYNTVYDSNGEPII